MDETPSDRRRFLALVSGSLTVGVAGCSALTGSKDTPDEAPPGGTETTETGPSTPALSVSISTANQPSQLPPIWRDHSIEDFQAQFTVETSGSPESVTVSNGKVELTQDSAQWADGMLTVQPGQMKRGEQEFTATASHGDQHAQDTATAAKPTPGTHKLDIVPQRNDDLRTRISENADEANYLQQRGGFVTDDPVFDTYSSHEKLGFDKVGIDLAAYEWYHDDDYTGLPPRQDIETKDWVESIGTDTGNSTIEAIKSGGKAREMWYPNGSFEDGRVGSFDNEEFANADTVGEALGWIHPYLFNWHSVMTDRGPISTEDALYAPALEQAIESKNNNNLEVHAWDVNLGGGHGNGLIYGKNADGSEELRVMETVSSPVTGRGKNRQLHPLIEDSGYLTPGNDGFEEYWHPLRFGWEDHYAQNGDGFESHKRSAARMIEDMAHSSQLTEGDGVMTQTDKVAATTEYVLDFTEKLRNFNSNDADFKKLYNQAKVMDSLLRDQENNHIIYGYTENPQYAAVDGHYIVRKVWADAAGEYDDFDDYLAANPQYATT